MNGADPLVLWCDRPRRAARGRSAKNSKTWMAPPVDIGWGYGVAGHLSRAVN
jgi:hypothetical protein